MSHHNIKVNDREYVVQEAYEWPLAIYLFFGGLAGALVTIGVFLYYMGLSETVVIVAILSAIVSMSIAGIVLVLFELLRPLAAFRSLVNWRHSGISWDVILVSLVIGGGLFFVLPLLSDQIGNLGGLTTFLASIQGLMATLTVVAGVLFPIISGGLLSAFNSVPLWHSPALPVVFFLTSFSSGFSYLILVNSSYLSETAVKGFWGFIFGLSTLLILISLSYLETIKNGPVEAQLGLKILKKSNGFIFGFGIIGLIVPALFGAWLFFGNYATWVAVIGALSVLVGGFVFRHYILKAGVHTYPWPY